MIDRFTMDRTPSSSQEAAKVLQTSEKPAPVTPMKSLVSLAVPDLLAFARRSSPRAEDTAKMGTKRKTDTTRQRILTHSSMDDAVHLLRKSSKIVVLSGAGISTSVDIPDFRSDKGLYHMLNHELGIQEPEDFFSHEFFQANPAQFFQYVKGVLPRAVACSDGTYKASDSSATVGPDGSAEVPRYSPTHAFLAMLQAKQKLLTNYTQNIDGLEIAAGLTNTSVIQCHGAWDTATCLTCGKRSSARKYLAVVFQGNVPYCKCSLQINDSTHEPKGRSKKSKTKSGKKRKRPTSKDWSSDHSSDAYDNIIIPKGLLKPDITFFQDPINEAYKGRLQSDRPVMDLLIVIGTSLKVTPVAEMLYQVPAHVPQVYISKTRFSGGLCNLPGVQVDIELLGEADAIIEELCRRAGWSDQLESHLWRKGQIKINSCPVDGMEDKDRLVNDYGVAAKRIKSESTENLTPAIPDRSRDRMSSHLEGSKQRPVKMSKRGEDFADTQASNDKQDRAAMPATKVKVELVEGTAHQWRVTRLS